MSSPSMQPQGQRSTSSQTQRSTSSQTQQSYQTDPEIARQREENWARLAEQRRQEEAEARQKKEEKEQRIAAILDQHSQSFATWCFERVGAKLELLDPVEKALAFAQYRSSVVEAATEETAAALNVL